LNHPVLEEFVVAVGEIATLPSTVVRLLELLKDSTTSAFSVLEVLERDPAMTANVLKLTNSAFYGNRKQISNVRDALVMLGNRSVATLAFFTGMAPIMRRELDGYGISRESFWNHCLLSAAASSLVADHLNISHLRREAFTAGLVHDVGMLVIDQVLVARHQVIEPDTIAMGAYRGEKQTLGFDHCEAGAMIADKWGFPGELVQPILFHHDPVQAENHKELVRAVAAGNLIALSVDDKSYELVQGSLQECWEELGLDPALAEGMRDDLTNNLENTLTGATLSTPRSS